MSDNILTRAIVTDLDEIDKQIQSGNLEAANNSESYL